MAKKRSSSRFSKARVARKPEKKPSESGGARGGASTSRAGSGGWPRDGRIAAGVHAVREALFVRGAAAKTLWLRTHWEDSTELRQIEELARQARVPLKVLPPARLDQLCSSHQGAALWLSESPERDWQSWDEGAATLLLLDGIEDVGNLGAMMRTAWLTGVSGVILPEARAASITPAVHKVACGGVEHLPVLEVGRFEPTLKSLKEAGFWVFGLAAEADKEIFDLSLPEKVVWAIGSEEKGLRSTTRKQCDELVRIPQIQPEASFNASVATGMVLMETLRQRRSFGSGN